MHLITTHALVYSYFLKLCCILPYTRSERRYFLSQNNLYEGRCNFGNLEALMQKYIIICKMYTYNVFGLILVHVLSSALFTRHEVNYPSSYTIHGPLGLSSPTEIVTRIYN